MNYKSYGTKKTTRSRLTRKHMRRDVFVSNKKMARMQRKAERLKRKSLKQSEE